MVIVIIIIIIIITIIITIGCNTKEKITSAAWGPLNKTIICGFDDGTIRMFDANSNKMIGQTKEHTGTVVRLSMSKDKMLFMSASQDKTAKVLFNLLKPKNPLPRFANEQLRL